MADLGLPKNQAETRDHGKPLTFSLDNLLKRRAAEDASKVAAKKQEKRDKQNADQIHKRHLNEIHVKVW